MGWALLGATLRGLNLWLLAGMIVVVSGWLVLAWHSAALDAWEGEDDV